MSLLLPISVTLSFLSLHPKLFPFQSLLTESFSLLFTSFQSDIQLPFPLICSPSPSLYLSLSLSFIHFVPQLPCITIFFFSLPSFCTTSSTCIWFDTFGTLWNKTTKEHHRNQRRASTVEQIQSNISEVNSPLPKPQQMVSAVPRRIWTVVKRRVDAKQW